MTSDSIQESTPATGWSLGAVLAEREMDDETMLVLVRSDAGVTGALALRRRLVDLAQAGFRTLIVDLGDACDVGETTIAVLVGTRRVVGQRDARLVVAAERQSVLDALARAGLELAGPLAEE